MKNSNTTQYPQFDIPMVNGQPMPVGKYEQYLSTWDKYNPVNSSIDIGFSKNGINCHMGKDAAVWEIATITSTAFLCFWGGKFLCNHYLQKDKDTSAQKEFELKKELLNIKHMNKMEEIKFQQHKQKESSTPQNIMDEVPSENIEVEPAMHLVHADDFFKASNNENGNWIVDGYMQTGLIHFVAAGGGVGKTTFITQIALAVTKGTMPEFLPPRSTNSVKLPVAYFRLEDFANEFIGKYGRNGEVIKDSEIQWFVPTSPEKNNLADFLQYLKTMAGELTEDTLVCVDPATKMSGYKHNDFIRGVEEAMAIAKDKGVTITVIASIHTDEVKDYQRSYSCDIKGGDQALQKGGSLIVLNKERTNPETYRFLECLKSSKGTPTPFAGKCLVCKGVKTVIDANNEYLHYQYVGIKNASEVLPQKQTSVKSNDELACDSNKGRTGNNQKISPKIDSEIKKWNKNGLSVSEISDNLKDIGIDVCDKTIKRHLEGISKPTEDTTSNE